MAKFWENQEVVTRKNSYHVPQFRATHSMKQERLKSPTVLHVAVDSVVHHWLLLMVKDGAVTQDRLGNAVGQIMEVFYTNDRLMGSPDLEWLQVSLNILIRLFRRIGLEDNFAKPKTMTFQREAIILGMPEEAFVWRSSGKG